MTGKLFIICSPSGGGKGTLLAEVYKSVPNVYDSISYTTRQPRVGEQNGREYFFVTQTEFENLIAQGEFLEYAFVHGNYYGTSRLQVEKELSLGKDIILEIDVQGAEIIHQKVAEAISVFILPPSFEVLKKRLETRGTETDASLSLRLKNASDEVIHCRKFDYVTINEEVLQAQKDLKAIFFAERAKTARQTETIDAILRTFEN